MACGKVSECRWKAVGWIRYMDIVFPSGQDPRCAVVSHRVLFLESTEPISMWGPVPLSLDYDQRLAH